MIPAVPDVPATLDVVEPAWSDETTGRSGGSDAALLACAAHAACDPDRRGRAGVVGPSTGVRAAEALGLRVADRRPAPRRRLLTRTSAAPHQQAAPFVRLWGTCDRTIAQPGARMELHAWRAPTPEHARLGSLADRVLVRTEPDQAAWARVGVAAALADLPDMGLLAERMHSQRAPIRDRFELADTALLAPLADHPGAIDVRQLGFLLGFLAVSGRPVAGVIPRGARHRDLAWRHIRGLFGPCRLFETDLPAAALLPACDLALLPASEEGTGADRVLGAWAEAVGVPTVRWGQREPGKLRHTPGSAGAVVRALDAVRPGTPA